jgi:hypothetical protein
MILMVWRDNPWKRKEISWEVTNLETLVAKVLVPHDLSYLWVGTMPETLLQPSENWVVPNIAGRVTIRKVVTNLWQQPHYYSMCTYTTPEMVFVVRGNGLCIFVLENAQTVFIVVSQWGILHQHDSCYYPCWHFVVISIQIKCAFTDNEVFIRCLLISYLIMEILTEGWHFCFVLVWKGLHQLHLCKVSN